MSFLSSEGAPVCPGCHPWSSIPLLRPIGRGDHLGLGAPPRGGSDGFGRFRLALAPCPVRIEQREREGRAGDGPDRLAEAPRVVGRHARRGGGGGCRRARRGRGGGSPRVRPPPRRGTLR